MNEKSKIKKQVLNLIKNKKKINKSKIYISEKVYNEQEIINALDSILEFNLTEGKYSKKVEQEFKNLTNSEYFYLVNSGSSANLLAFMALTSPSLKERRIKRGDYVIVTPCCFPTTITPILQYGAVPTFVDCKLDGNINENLIEKNITTKTKAIVVAHTLGKPNNLEIIKNICDKYNLWLIGDCCDALGALYKGIPVEHYHDISTYSFYPAHHITCGEGGGILTNNSLLAKIIKSMRDWGRDCICNPGEDNKCGKRFSRTYETLPLGYDHKYVYSELGYNLKITDIQASILLAQLKKLPKFIKKRNENHTYLYKKLSNFDDFLILPEIEEKEIIPSWFGFLIIVKPNELFKRKDLVNYLEYYNIQTRPLFAGNILKHPCILNNNLKIKKEKKYYYADFLLEHAFWIGIHPGLNKEKLDFIVNCFDNFFNEL